MPFPLSWSGTFNFPKRQHETVDATSLLTAIQKALAEKRIVEFASTKTNEDSRMEFSFYVPFNFFVPGWDLLASIDRGVISASVHPADLNLRYRIDFKRLVWIAIGLAIFGGFIPAIMLPRLRALELLCGIWLWVVGVNYVVSVIRFHMMIRAILLRADTTS